MKVSMCTPTFFSFGEGESNVILQLGKALVKNGLKVILFTFVKGLGTSSSLLSEGMTTLEGVIIKKYKPKVLRVIGVRPQYYSSQLIKDIFQEGSDVLHIHDFSQIPLLFSLLRKVKSPAVLSPHKFDEILPNFSFPFGKKLLNWTFHYISKKISRFIVDTPQNKSILMKMGTPEEKIALIQLNLDYLKMSSIKRNEEDIILTIGRYAPHKGLHILVDAARVILNKYPHIKFYLVGTIFDKDYYQLLQEKSKGLEGNIYLTGPLKEEEFANLFARAKVFIFPSIQDTHGLVNFEAMAAGIPVIATTVESTIPFIQDGINGILIPPDNVSFLVESIVNLWDNKEKRTLLVKNGKEMAKRYFWQKFSQEIIKIYQNVVGSKLK